MRTGWVRVACVLSAALVAPIVLAAQQKAAKTPSLTAADYIEIRELVARYAYAVDTGADSGNVYASLFAPGGEFVVNGMTTTGKDALAAMARQFTRGRQSAYHFMMNHVIEPSADGATGKQYVVQLRMGEPGQPNGVGAGGRYDDVYVKTADGWRFKRREFVASERPPRRPPANRPPPQ
jgi:uncharacterized protein (TIGR02246 family)